MQMHSVQNYAKDANIYDNKATPYYVIFGGVNI